MLSLTAAFDSNGKVADAQPVYLMMPTNELCESAETAISRESACPWVSGQWNGKHGADFANMQSIRQSSDFKIGQMRWPTGASRWGYGHFLVSSSQAETLMRAIFYSQATGSTDPLVWTLSMNSPGLPIPHRIELYVHLLPLIPLYRPVDSKAVPLNGLYLVTVVDNRYFWWNRTTASPAIDWSNWYSLVDSALTAVERYFPVKRETRTNQFNSDKLPSVKYSKPDPVLATNENPLPLWLDAIAVNIGCRFAFTYDWRLRFMFCQDAFDQFTNIDRSPMPMSPELSSNPIRGGFRQTLAL